MLSLVWWPGNRCLLTSGIRRWSSTAAQLQNCTQDTLFRRTETHCVFGGMTDFSFLCTFIPGSEKSTDGTFAPVELFFRGRFAPWNFRSLEAKVPREMFTFLWPPPYLQSATSEMRCWSGGSGILTELSLCYSIVCHYNGTRWYEQFLQVGWLVWALILLGLALSSECLCIFGLYGAIYTVKIFLHPFYLLVSWA